MFFFSLLYFWSAVERGAAQGHHLLAKVQKHQWTAVFLQKSTLKFCSVVFVFTLTLQETCCSMFFKLDINKNC